MAEDPGSKNILSGLQIFEQEQIHCLSSTSNGSTDSVPVLLKIAVVFLEDCRKLLGVDGKWSVTTPRKSETGEGQHVNSNKWAMVVNGRAISMRHQTTQSDSCKNLTKLANLKTHKEGEMSYLCSDCGKTLSHFSSLQRHLRMHKGEKSYLCSNCGKNFSRLSHLKIHQRIHTGEKPYLCSDCGRTFTHVTNLQTHQRIHTGEKPYHCSDCGKNFSTLYRLQRHQIIHTGEKPYHCFVCGKNFSISSNLKTHQRRIHTK